MRFSFMESYITTPGRDELHQVLVGGDDGDGRARVGGLAHVGGDEVVGFKTVLLDAGQVEGAHRLADQPELRLQVLRRLGAVRLVLVVERVAKGGGGGVEDHGEMGRRPRRRSCRA